MLMRLFYVSEIVEPVTAVDIQVILGQSQVRNRRLDVTGMLAMSDGHFCQVLEGRPAAVSQVMSRVRRSERHRRLRVLLEEPIKRRCFGRWAMELVVRHDMAGEMRALQDTGELQGKSVHDVIAELMPPGAGAAWSG